MDPLTNRAIRGYELLEQIGIGGMGAVYRAYQAVVEREVAVKVIRPDYANQSEFIRSFEVETRLVARLEHPHIVPLCDYWREPDSAYLVMRWIRGGSLAKVLQTGGAWGVQATARHLDQIAGALSAAHRANVVHRDLKPDNILIDDDGNAYLTDFGIAKVIGEDDPTGGDIKGTLSYIAPEQLMGAVITPQADIYSLGLIVYEMLTGVHVFAGSSLSEIITKHLTEPIPNPQILRPDLPGLLNDILQKATAKEPTQRYADVREMALEFHQALAQDMTTTSELAQMVGDQINPYKGLRAFDEADALDFFGREALVGALLNRLEENTPYTRFLAVVGPSGSGKSSVVRAGLIPALRAGGLTNSDQWFVTTFVPGEHPLQSLEAALHSIAIRPMVDLFDQLRADARGLLWAADRLLGSQSGDLLLVIDQFEEVFTLADETERSQLFALLHAAVSNPQSRVRVVITLRADFYDRPLLYEGFGDLIQARTQVVLPLTAQELERAISAPAGRIGVQVDPELIAAIIADVREEPGALPLLQYALMEVFERRAGRRMTLDAYLTSGGVSGALARRAEEVYALLSADQQQLTRQMLLRLITLGEGAEDTRRRARLSELLAVAGDNEQLNAVLNAFGGYRLLTFDVEPETREPLVEVAHEAIIREWTRLREWLNESRSDVRLQRGLASAAADWDTSGHDVSYLLGGTRLGQNEDWAKGAGITLTPTERTYLDVSIAERNRLDVLETERQTHEKSRERRIRRLLQTIAAILSVGVVSLLVATGVAINRGDVAVSALASATAAQGKAQIEALNADNARQTSVYQANNAATQERLALDSAATNDANVATAVAAQSTAERGEVEARSLALAANAQQVYTAGDTDLALALALAANDVNAPPSGAQNALAAIAFAPGTRFRFAEGEHIITAVAFSPDGSMMLDAELDGKAVIRDVATGEARILIDPGLYFGASQLGAGSIGSVAYSPDGNSLLIGSSVGAINLWDIYANRPIRTFEHPYNDYIGSVTFSPDMHYALSGGGLFVSLWDVGTGQEIRRFTGHTQKVNSVAFSPDGREALSGAEDSQVILWNVESGQEIRRFIGNTGMVNEVAFSPDGEKIISTGSEFADAVIIWDKETGNEIRRITGLGVVQSLVVRPDGKLVAAGTADGLIVLLDIETGHEIARLKGEGKIVTNVTFSPDGRFLYAGYTNGSVRLWTVETSAEIRRLQGHGGSFATTTDGKMVFSGSGDGTILQWETATGNPIRLIGHHDDTVLGVALSPDNQLLLTGSLDTTARLWDVATGAELHRLDLGDGFYGLRTDFSPDGSKALVLALANTATGNSLVYVLDVATWQVIKRYEFDFNTDGSLTDAIFSPDNCCVLVGLDKTELDGEKGTLRLINLQTDQVERTYEGHRATIYGMAYSPDGQSVAAGSFDNTAILWDADTARPLHEFVGHTDYILNLAFSLDGRYLATSSRESRIILWDVDTGTKIIEYPGHGEQGNGLAFTPDSRYLISSGSDGTRRIWLLPLPLNEMVKWVYTNHFVPELTCGQRAQYNIIPLCDESGEFPTRTPYPSLTPSPTYTTSPTPDLTLVTTTSTYTGLIPTNTLTFTPTITLTPSQTPTPIPTSEKPLPSVGEILNAAAHVNFQALLPDKLQGLMVSKVLAAKLADFPNLRFVWGEATPPGEDIFLMTLVGDNAQLNIIQIRSPFIDAHDWTLATLGELGQSLVEYREIAGVECGIQVYGETSVEACVVNKTLVALAFDDTPTNRAAAENAIASLVTTAP